MSTIAVVIIIVLIILLFFIFRAILLWYWKVDIQVELMTKNNELLEKIFSELKASNKDEKEQESNHTLPLQNTSKNETESELDKLKKNLKKDEVIVRMKDNNEYVVISKLRYDTERTMILGNNYIFIYEKERS